VGRRCGGSAGRGARIGGCLAAAAAALALGGCIGEERELEIGALIATQINHQLPLLSDPLVDAYVSELGSTLAAQSERPNLQFRFYVVDNPGLNAFALPGGHVYVHRGLLERTRTGDELAGVLAHEIAHVAARHGVQNLQRQLRTRTMAATMYHLILNRRPLLDQEVLDLGGALWHASHSRRAEMEADRMAVRYMVRAEHDPRGMLTLFEMLRREERRAGAPSGGSWFATHPGTPRRMAAARDEIRGELAGAPARGPVEDDGEHAAVLARLRALPRAMLLPVHLPSVHVSPGGS
jgi:beta-barrel assembly-enhancing protease